MAKKKAPVEYIAIIGDEVVCDYPQSLEDLATDVRSYMKRHNRSEEEMCLSIYEAREVSVTVAMELTIKLD